MKTLVLANQQKLTFISSVWTPRGTVGERERESRESVLSTYLDNIWIFLKFQRILNQNPIDRWMKGCILPFPKKGNLRLAKNYRGITLTSIVAKIYNALLHNRTEPKIDNIGRTKMASREIDLRSHKFWLSVEFLKV